MVLLLIDIDIVKQKLEKPFSLRQWLKLPKCSTHIVVKKVLGEMVQNADFMQRPFPEKEREIWPGGQGQQDQRAPAPAQDSSKPRKKKTPN